MGGTREIMELTMNSDRLLPSNQLEFKEEFFDKTNVSESMRIAREIFGVATIIKQYESLLEDQN
jgi:hypothetical protein